MPARPSESDVPENAVTVAKQELPDIDQMSQFEVMFNICKEIGYQVVGDPRTVFAAFCSSNGKLSTYAVSEAVSEKYIEHISSETEELGMLGIVQELGGSFNVCGDKVICVLKNVTATGSSYGDAALRAVLALQRK